MRILFPILLILSSTLHAQEIPYRIPTLNIGDPAPPLYLRQWLKGKPIQHFEKGRVYVLEFFATWCAPCRAAMPHLSDLAEKYKRKVTVLGIDLFAKEIIPMEKVQAFVDNQGDRLNYPVAAEDSNFMSANWLYPSDQDREGIPRTIIVDQEGRLAWMGHPKDLHEVLPKIVKGNWNVKEALAKQKLDKYLDSLDTEAFYRLMPYRDNIHKEGDQGRPDLALLAINSIVINEPRLKYTIHMAFETFTNLLKTDMKKALEYGREAIKTRGYRYHGSYPIHETVGYLSDKINLSPAIYELGADAYQEFIDYIPYAENSEMKYLYSKMADFYFRANKKSKAIRAQEKAIAACKSIKDYSAEDLAALESRLSAYKKM